MDADQTKLLNDLDLRLAVEQKGELRHAETVTLAGGAVAAAVIGKLFGSGSSVFGPALYASGALLVVVGVVADRRTRVAEQSLISFCARFAERNGVPSAEIAAIVGLKSGRARVERTIVPMFSFFAGVLILAIAATIMVAHRHR